MARHFRSQREPSHPDPVQAARCYPVLGLLIALVLWLPIAAAVAAMTRTH